MNSGRTLLALVSVTAVAFTCVYFANRKHPPVKTRIVTSAAAGLSPEFAAAISDYSRKPERAAVSLREFVDSHKESADPKVQDEVGTARIRLGFLAAHKKDWPSARASFQEAAIQYKGTGVKGADFGGIPDQGAYQAAVCLMAAGKKDEAKAEFLKFMKEQPLSPLVKAAHRRLVMLNGGKPMGEWDTLLDADLAKQQAHIRFEMSVCGPKCIERMLKASGRQPLGYKAIAKLCGTTDKGTTIEGMRKGLAALGIPSYAFRLNAADYRKMPLPAIVLREQHYVLVEKIGLGKATIFDPLTGGEATQPLPAPDDSAFSADVILFTQPTLNP